MQTVPQPLRRKPVLKAADSRYVSLFSDADNKSDITISDGHKGLLPKSTKLYEVGIDNLTLSMNGLSMLTPSATEPIILEILALRTYGGQNAGGLAQNLVVANWTAFPAGFRLGTQVATFGVARDYQLLDSDIFTTVAQFMDRLDTIAAKISETINAGFAAGAHFEFDPVLPFTVVPAEKHLEFRLHNSGRLQIRGSRTFWSYFCIHMPNAHYRSIFLGSYFNHNQNQRILSVNPRTGELFPTLGDARLAFAILAGAERALTKGWASLDLALNAQFEAQVSNNPALPASQAFGSTIFGLMLHGNLYSSLDERVCIEVGTSLPMTHSALIEDNKEKPDYSLGRFMFDSGLRINYSFGEESHEVHGPSTYEMMSSEKRVMYHRLMPQEKVSVLRIQMYIRRRVYDVVKNLWTMRVDPLPTISTDWWHCRLHFRELHETAISQKQSPYQ